MGEESVDTNVIKRRVHESHSLEAGHHRIITKSRSWRGAPSNNSNRTASPYCC